MLAYRIIRKYTIIFASILASLPANPALAAREENNSQPTINAAGGLDFVKIKILPNSIELELDLEDRPHQVRRGRENDVVIHMNGFEANDRIGEPSLPRKILLVELPPDLIRGSIHFEITGLSAIELEENFEITPVPGPGPAAIHGDGGSTWAGEIPKRDESLYASARDFPDQPLIPSSVIRSGERLFMPLELWPLQYNPQSGAVRKFNCIKCRIEYETTDPSGNSSMRGGIFSSDILEEHASELFHGPVSLDGNGYAIITTNDIVSNSQKLNDFIDCKERYGYSVHVVTEDDFGVLTGQPPDGTAEKIRQWLIQNYMPLGLRFVLLVGNPDPDDPTNPADPVGDIPMKMLYPRAGNSYYWNDYNSPSDYYYADLTGNWNLDGDELFGECRPSTYSNTPDPLINENTFSVRWTGQIAVPAEGMRLALYYDDGVRVWIDDLEGAPTIDDWQDRVAGNRYVDIHTAGMHDVKIEYYQNTSNAFIRFFKGSIGASWYNGLNTSMMYYWNGDAHQQGGFNAEYFNDKNLTEPAFTRVDNTSSFQWFSGDRDAGGVDFLPEVCVGRIPVYNGQYAYLDSILVKSIAYQYSKDASWRDNVLLPMKPFDDSTPNYHLGEQIKNELCSIYGAGTYRIYDGNYDCSIPPEVTPCTADTVLAAWQNPFGLVVWATHGSSSGASSVMYSGLCSQLSNATPAIVMQGSCNNGQPESSGNLGYSLLLNGAVGTVSATRTSWYTIGFTHANPGDLRIHGFCYSFAQNVMQDYSAGESLCMVKAVSANSISDDKWMNIMDFNLYGDPSLSLADCWTTPVLLADFQILTGAEGVVTVTWQLSSESDPARFRLDASMRGEYWEVPYTLSAHGLFTAADPKPVLEGGGDVTYSLYYRNGGGDWTLLMSREISVAVPSASTGFLAASPNPFRRRTAVSFSVKHRQKIELAVFDVRGRRIATLANRWFERGRQSMTWDGNDPSGRKLPSGIYFLRMKSDDGIDSKKLLMVR